MPSLLCCVIVFTLSTHTDPYLSVLEKPKRSLLKGSTKIWFYVNKHILKEFQWIQLNWKYNLKLSEWLKAFHLLQWLDVTFRCYFGSVPKRKKNRSCNFKQQSSISHGRFLCYWLHLALRFQPFQNHFYCSYFIEKDFGFFFATKRFESIIFFQIWTTFSCVKVAIIQRDVVVLIKLLPSKLKSRKFYHQSQKCHWLVCCGVKIHASDV